MKKTSFLTFLLLLINLLIPLKGKNCGGNYMGYHMLFDRDLVFSKGESLTSYNNWNYNSNLYGSQPMQLQNANEWASFLDEKYPAEDLIPIIYREGDFTSQSKELNNLRQVRISEKDITQKEIAFLNYLELSLQVEKHLADYNVDPWSTNETQETKNPERYLKLVSKINEMTQETNYLIIRERLAFQLIKLYRYEENYTDVLSTFEKNFNESKSFISYWAMDHYAGALNKLERKAEANYYFSKVYVNSPSRRQSAYYSISINSDQEMNDAKNLCQTKDEKLALHFIRGMEPINLAINDIEFINDNAENHEYAKVMMSFEINKLEHFLLYRGEGSFSNFEDDNPIKSNEEAINYLKRLIILNQKILPNDDSNKFWHLSLSYLYFLNKDYANCKTILDENIPKDTDLKRQHTIIEMLNYVSSKSELSVTDENIIGNKLLKMDSYLKSSPNISYYNYRINGEDYNTEIEYLFELIYSKVKGKNLFKELVFNGKTISSDLILGDFKEADSNYPRVKLTVAYIDNLISSYKTTDKTKLLDYAVQVYFESKDGSADYSSYSNPMKLWFKDPVDRLNEIKATLLMRNPNKLREALALFETIPNYEIQTKTTNADLFEIKSKNPMFQKYHETMNGYEAISKLDLAKELNTLYEKAKSTNDALSYLKLGTAYYNLSYYGTAWELFSYYRDFVNVNGFYDNSIALNFLKQAITIGLKNKELEAKAYFMAARCELNLFTQNYGTIPNNSFPDQKYFDEFMVDIKQQGFQNNFASLKNLYSATQFYKEIISECNYFSYYVKR